VWIGELVMKEELKKVKLKLGLKLNVKQLLVGSSLLILLCSCASTNPVTGEEETHYPLIDTRLKMHKYKDNIQWQLFVKNNPRTEYCSVHFVWEDILPLYRPSGDGEYRWVYQVNKNKKSWK